MEFRKIVTTTLYVRQQNESVFILLCLCIFLAPYISDITQYLTLDNFTFISNKRKPWIRVTSRILIFAERIKKWQELVTVVGPFLKSTRTLIFTYWFGQLFFFFFSVWCFWKTLTNFLANLVAWFCLIRELFSTCLWYIYS